METLNNNTLPNIYSQYIDYQDTDAGGVVYHSSYVNFAERARGKLFRSLFSSKVLLEYLWVVTELTAKFIAPAKLGELITLKTTVSDIKNCSVVFKQNVFVNNQLRVSMLVRIASLDSEFKVAKFTNEIKEKLIKYKLENIVNE